MDGFEYRFIHTFALADLLVDGYGTSWNTIFFKFWESLVAFDLNWLSLDAIVDNRIASYTKALVTQIAG